METSELRTMSVEELQGRVRQWKKELFQFRFKTHGAESRDTSVPRKLKRVIARAATLLREKELGIVVKEKAVADKPVKKTSAKKAVKAKDKE
jgi:ribosomal protein L29